MADILYMVPNTEPGRELILDEAGKWDGLTFRKELIYEGSFVKKVPGKEAQHFTVDEAKLNHWEHTGNRMVRNGVKVPVPVKHTDEPERNRARVLRYEVGVNDKGKNALYGVMRFRDHDAAKLAASTDVSIFVPEDSFTDGLGNKYTYAIKHVALTDYPVIPGLSDFKAIAASYDAPKRHRRLKLSAEVDPTTTRGDHAANAAIHGAVGAFEAHHLHHVVKGLVKSFNRRNLSVVAKKTGALGPMFKDKAAKIGIRTGAKAAAKIGMGGIAKVGLQVAAKHALPIALGALAAHGVYHSAKGLVKSLSAIPKAPKSPKPVVLSLSDEARDKNGKWAQRGRNVAAAGVGIAATGKVVKSAAIPLAHIGLHVFAKKHGLPIPKLSGADKAHIAVNSLVDAAHSVALGRIADHINRPSDEKVHSKTQRTLAGLGAIHLAAHATEHGVKGLQRARQTVHAAKFSQMGSNATDKLLFHALTTRPVGLAALGHVAAVGGLAYAAHRAYKRATRKNTALSLSEKPERVTLKMRREAEKKNAAENVHHPNIFGRDRGGRFAPKAGGHTSSREFRKLRHLQTRAHNIRDDSDEDLKSKHKLQAALQIGKHISLGAVEGGAAATGVYHAIHQLGKAGHGIWKSSASTRGAATRIAHGRRTATKFAAAAAAVGLASRRFDAIHTHLKTLFSKAE